MNKLACLQPSRPVVPAIDLFGKFSPTVLLSDSSIQEWIQEGEDEL